MPIGAIGATVLIVRLRGTIEDGRFFFLARRRIRPASTSWRGQYMPSEQDLEFCNERCVFFCIDYLKYKYDGMGVDRSSRLVMYKYVYMFLYGLYRTCTLSACHHMLLLWQLCPLCTSFSIMKRKPFVLPFHCSIPPPHDV